MIFLKKYNNQVEKISIIVPCYNIESLVADTVKTICEQTYRNLEIILVDDGSKDTTGAVIDQLAEQDNRIRTIHKENGGVTRARLAGVAAATGEWIGFVDGDDAIEPDMYERLLKNAHQYGADISHCGYQMVFPSRVDYYYNTGRLLEQDNFAGLKELLSGLRVEPGLCNKLYHKKLFSELVNTDLMDLSIKNTEDLLMNYYLFKEADKSIYEDFCPYRYIVRTGSAANTISENKLRDPVKVLHILQKNTAGQPELQSLVDERLVTMLIWLIRMSAKSHRDLILPYQKKAKKELRVLTLKLWRESHSSRIRLHATWAAFFPLSYRGVHHLYARIKGTDRKYEVS